MAASTTAAHADGKDAHNWTQARLASEQAVRRHLDLASTSTCDHIRYGQANSGRVGCGHLVVIIPSAAVSCWPCEEERQHHCINSHQNDRKEIPNEAPEPQHLLLQSNFNKTRVHFLRRDACSCSEICMPESIACLSDTCSQKQEEHFLGPQLRQSN